MATTPEKTSNISFTSTNLSDSGLPITTISKANLVNFLNGVQGTEVAFYFASADDSSTDIHLMLAEKVIGGISGSNGLQSAALPCPKFCKE